MASFRMLEKTGLPLLLAIGLFAPKALAQIRIYNVNAIHDLDSENELAAKSSTTIKMQLYLEESIRSTMNM